MSSDSREKQKRYPPSNISSHYYTDPVYSSDGFYGYERDNNDETDEGIQEAVDLEDPEDFEALDEPVESWGWVNNTDTLQSKEKRGY